MSKKVNTEKTEDLSTQKTQETETVDTNQTDSNQNDKSSENIIAETIVENPSVDKAVEEENSTKSVENIANENSVNENIKANEEQESINNKTKNFANESEQKVDSEQVAEIVNEQQTAEQVAEDSSEQTTEIKEVVSEQSLATEQAITANVQSAKKSENPPVSTMLMMYSGHLGKILSNISIVAVFLSILGLFTIFLPIYYFLFAFIILIVASVFTFGLIYLAYPNFINDLFGFNDKLAVVLEFVMKALPIVAGISLVAAALSIIFLALDRTQNHSVRLTTSISLLVVSILAVVLLIVGVVSGAWWTK